MWKNNRWFYQDEASETNAAGGGAAAGGEQQGTPAGGDQQQEQTPAGGEAKPAGEEKKEVAQTDMVAAIDAGLGYEPGKDGDGKVVEKKPAAAAAAGAPAGETEPQRKDREAKEAAAAARKELETKAAAGDAAAKAELDKQKKAEEAAARKPKDLKALELTADDKKTMSAKTQARFNEVLGIVKVEREARVLAERQVGALAKSRDAILGVLQETNTTDEDLVQYLEYNRLTKTGRPEDLALALKQVEGQALALRRALGVKGDGHDPLAAYPDLLKEVEDQAITEARALEIAANRRREALNKNREDGERQRGAQQAQRTENFQKSVDSAAAAIGKWATGLESSDLDYKAKEDKLLLEFDRVQKQYPPNLWLPTLKLIYENISIAKVDGPNGEQQPLRPSGRKPGDKAPSSMLEAIDAGLGYQPK